MARRRRSARRPSALVLVLAGVAVLAVIAIVAAGGGDGDGGTVDGGDTPAAAPVVTGDAIGSGTVTIGDEHPALVMFVAHWCPHCQREVPRIVEWLETNGRPEGIALEAVSTAADPSRDNYPPAEWLAREEWTIPTLDDDDGTVAEAYGVTGFPYFVAVGADGQIVARTSGELTIEQLEALMAEARAG